jgi:hypothetical protein
MPIPYTATKLITICPFPSLSQPVVTSFTSHSRSLILSTCFSPCLRGITGIANLSLSQLLVPTYDLTSASPIQSLLSATTASTHSKMTAIQGPATVAKLDVVSHTSLFPLSPASFAYPPAITMHTATPP